MPKRSMEQLTESMFYVLMTLTVKPRCGIDIAACIERRTQGRIRIGPATLYTILAKFEQEKYIKEIRVEGRRRTYRITERGQDAYLTEVERLRACLADAEKDWEEVAYESDDE